MPRRSTDPPRVPLTSDPAAKRLTPREHAIALLIAEGLDDGTVARRLGMTKPAVQIRILHARGRSGLNSRAELVAWVAARIDPTTGPLCRAEAED